MFSPCERKQSAEVVVAPTAMAAAALVARVAATVPVVTGYKRRPLQRRLLAAIDGSHLECGRVAGLAPGE